MLDKGISKHRHNKCTTQASQVLSSICNAIIEAYISDESVRAGCVLCYLVATQNSVYETECSRNRQCRGGCLFDGQTGPSDSADEVKCGPRVLYFQTCTGSRTALNPPSLLLHFSLRVLSNAAFMPSCMLRAGSRNVHVLSRMLHLCLVTCCFEC